MRKNAFDGLKMKMMKTMMESQEEVWERVAYRSGDEMFWKLGAANVGNPLLEDLWEGQSGELGDFPSTMAVEEAVEQTPTLGKVLIAHRKVFVVGRLAAVDHLRVSRDSVEVAGAAREDQSRTTSTAASIAAVARATNQSGV